MSYIICENCGGYYELQEGESLDDFDSCNCGGRLSFTRSMDTSYPSESRYSGRKNSSWQSVMHCPVCGHPNKRSALLCTKCNSYTRSQNISARGYSNSSSNNFSDRYDYQNVLQNYIGNANGWKGLFKKINWWGVIMGLIFLVVAYILTSIVLVLGLVHVALQNPDEQALMNFFGGSMLISVLVMILSGFVAVATTKSATYPEGILNGGLVGGVLGFLLGAFAGLIAFALISDAGGISNFLLIIPVTLWYICLYGAMTASGGILAILVRRHTGII